MVDDLNISAKLKDYLERKLKDCKLRLVKLKRKKKIIQVLYVSTVVSSIVISSLVASLASILSMPIIVITVLSTGSAILTGISVRFNFRNKKVEINNLIEKLSKIQSKLDYVISCNGDLTQTEYQEILKEFSF